ncbi:MAG: Rap1a/Tai family immunity protein [Proteobacteria bacterium]|nr:Rap1a/Tai family immunity protein [Pseudomonadota bacterium]
MRRALLLAACLLLPAVSPPPAAAGESFSGRDLGNNCKNQQICDAFFAGMLDSYSSLLGWRQAAPAFCITGPSAGHLLWPGIAADIIGRDDLAISSAASLAYLSLEARFPCQPGQPAVAQPTFLSGIDLGIMCQDIGLCEAFLIGVVDLHRTLVDRGDQPPLMCAPPEVQNDELTFSLLTYLSGHQNELEFSAGSLALTALAESYGCGP